MLGHVIKSNDLSCKLVSFVFFVNGMFVTEPLYAFNFETVMDKDRSSIELYTWQTVKRKDALPCKAGEG
jgi:hypothetical protein